MSHVTEVGLHITDLDAAEEAAPLCGMRLVRGQRTHRWYGRFLNDWSDRSRAAALNGRDPKTFGHCDHALVLQDARGDDYEIGLVARADGNGYDAVYDTWGPGARLEAAAGKALGKFKDEYAFAATAKRLRRQRFSVTRFVDEHGKLNLKAERRSS